MTDAFGKGLFSYLKNKDDAPYIIRRDDNYTDKFPPSKYFMSYSRWPAHEKKILKFVRGKVLDIGAGAGRHSLWLQKKGLKVTAIDVSPLAIKVMQEKGVKNVILMNINKLNFPKNSFDTILIMGNSLGLAGNIKNTKKVLKKLERIASKKGRIIANIRNPAKTKDPKHLAYHERNRRRGKPIGQVKMTSSWD